ncbi:hypothetical protein WR25_23053 [Diploscapter pachys]|uniref:Carbonic anhydrase n=1 Tax=Diploscapter pachys TaxID=2018661 RepID=A0A2A2JD16_9BILA|nr:hypothetical protein WR25_23053 [Diploscapter pachys]
MQLLTVVCLLSTFLTDVVLGADSSNWGYDRANGPQTWKGECDVGDRQSPIDIRLSEVDYALIHRVHLLHYDFSGPVEMTNNGRTLVMTGFDKWDNGRKQPIMRGGGLKHTYRLIQLHLHWGHSHAHGSEHTLNGLSYPAELHLVHVREGLDVGKASNVKDGLAVLGVWLVEGENDSNFAQISDNLHYLLFDGNRTSLDKFYPRRLLPERTASFYRFIACAVYATNQAAHCTAITVQCSL